MSYCLPLFRRGEWYESLDTHAIPPGLGGRVATAPGLLLLDDLRWQRSSVDPDLLPPDRQSRAALLAEGLERFAHGDVRVGGLHQTPADFFELLWDHLGLPPRLSRRWCRILTDRLEQLVEELDESPDATPGEVWLISLPSNTFVCLEKCLEAALRGATIWMRPSQREPFSTARFVAALEMAGWPAAGVAFYPMSRDVLATLAPKVDLAVLYGGADVRVRFASKAGVEVHGPGRARAIVGPRCRVEAASAWLCARMADDAGRFCTNVGTILVTDRAKAVARALAERLDAIPLNSSSDTPWPLAVQRNEAELSRVTEWVRSRLRPGDRWLTQRPLVAPRDEPIFAPSLLMLAEPVDHPLLGVELSFPFAVLAAVEARDVAALSAGAQFVHEFGYSSSGGGE